MRLTQMGLVLQAICMSLKHALVTKTYKKYYNLIFFTFIFKIFSKKKKFQCILLFTCPFQDFSC